MRTSCAARQDPCGSRAAAQYSLWSRDPEGAILDTCRELGIAFVAYSPLGRGFLTGAIPSREALDPGDYRLHSPRFQPEALEQARGFIALVERIARAKEITPAQVGCAWVLNQDANILVRAPASCPG